jgi:hypothetical protein
MLRTFYFRKLKATVVPVHMFVCVCILHTEVSQPNRELQTLRAHEKGKGKGQGQEERRWDGRREGKQSHLLACWFLACLILRP